jgi:hypothetical protein
MTAAFFAAKQPWVKDAACRDVPTDIFFEAGYEEEAKAYCGGCGVRDACLALAFKEEGTAHSGRYGVRGGMTPDERRRHLRRRKVNGRGGEVAVPSDKVAATTQVADEEPSCPN